MKQPLPYRDFGTWIAEHFPYKVQKLPIDAGLTCPNRDGRLGWNGCIFCNNEAFNPLYNKKNLSLSEQIAAGKNFFARKYPQMHFIAYLQAYTNTYSSIPRLKDIYETVLKEDGIEGISIATRPDCVDENLLDFLQELSRHTFVIVEYGIETTNDKTLSFINRGHDFSCAQRIVELTAKRGIYTCGHVILGLPGEDKEENLRQADIISAMPLTILKIHQLQVIRNTTLEKLYEQAPFPLYTVEEYIELLADYIQRLRSDIVLERFVSQTPKHLLVAPHWGIKPQEFNERLVEYMQNNQIWQGKKACDINISCSVTNKENPAW